MFGVGCNKRKSCVSKLECEGSLSKKSYLTKDAPAIIKGETRILKRLSLGPNSGLCSDTLIRGKHGTGARVSGGICPLSSDWARWNWPNAVSCQCFLFPGPEQEPFHWIKDQMRRLSSDHFNSHLAFGVSGEQKKTGELCLFPLEARCLLRPSLSYIKRCLSHVVRGRGQASHRNMASIGIRSGHSQPLSIIGSCIQNKERNKTKPDLFLRRVWNQAFPFQAVIG